MNTVEDFVREIRLAIEYDCSFYFSLIRCDRNKGELECSKYLLKENGEPTKRLLDLVSKTNEKYKNLKLRLGE